MSDDVMVRGDLVVVETLQPLAVFGREGGVQSILDKIAAEARAEKTDISNVKGRKAVAALAYKIARSKTALDDMGKVLNEGRRAEINQVDADRRLIRSTLDALAAEIRAPLTAYEDAEKQRIAAEEDAIAQMKALGESKAAAGDLPRIDEWIADLDQIWLRPWDMDFIQKAMNTFGSAGAHLHEQRLTAVQYLADQAELARLRAEAEEAARIEAERVRREREARIAAEAAEAARLAAERQAQQHAAVERQRVEQARLDAERAAAERERQARAAADAERVAAAQREQEARDRADRADRAAKAAEAARVEAERRAVAEAAQAEIRAEQDRVKAVQAERRRAQVEQEQAQLEADKRAADRAHRGKVNTAAVRDLVAVGLGDAAARTAIDAIARGKVARVSVAY